MFSTRSGNDDDDDDGVERKPNAVSEKRVCSCGARVDRVDCEAMLGAATLIGTASVVAQVGNAARCGASCDALAVRACARGLLCVRHTRTRKRRARAHLVSTPARRATSMRERRCFARGALLARAPRRLKRRSRAQAGSSATMAATMTSAAISTHGTRACVCAARACVCGVFSSWCAHGALCMLAEMQLKDAERRLADARSNSR